MFSRRGMMKLAGAAGLAPSFMKFGQATAPTPGLPAGWEVATWKAQGAVNTFDTENKLAMESWEAARIILRDPAEMARVRAATYRKYRVLNGLDVDPDIAVMRSFSPMAKLTFQRQRIVEREIEKESMEPLWDAFVSIRDRMGKLMGL